MLYEVITNLDQLEAVGHQLGRWHAAASRFCLTKRPRLDPRQSLPLALAQLEEYAPWPTGLATQLRPQLARLVRQVTEGWHAEWTPLALHGDCHLGNILWRDGPLFVDLDDCLEGPAIQDLWLLLSGDQAEQRLQLDTLLAGYEEFAEFDHRQLALIEPLRTQRQIQHLAWLARRWADPAFPVAFPWFATEAFWLQQLQQLAEQERALAAAFGIAGETIHRKEEVAPAIARMLACPGAYLLHVAICPEENVWPLVPPGAANQQMLEAKA